MLNSQKGERIQMKVQQFGRLLLMVCLIPYFRNISANQSVEFNASLGSHDHYMQEYYEALQQKLDNPDSEWFRHLKPHKGRTAIKIFQTLYDNYVTSIKYPGCHTRIPKTIHQIWVGPNPFPEKYKAWQKTWQSIPGWTYKLWTDEDVESFQLINKEIYYKEKNYGARADILRLEILYRMGGLYVDTDYECIQPEIFDILHCGYDFYCGISPLDCSGLLLNNAIIASIPGHPILEAAIKEIQPLYEKLQDTNMWWGEAVVLKGPGLLTKMFIEHANKGYVDIAFPPTFFYPLGVYQINNQNWTTNFSRERFLDEVKKEIIKPETIAIHWWDGSWTLPEANEQK